MKTYTVKELIKELKDIVDDLKVKDLKVDYHELPLAGRVDIYLRRSRQNISSINPKPDKLVFWIQVPSEEGLVKEVASKLEARGFRVELVK